MTSPPGAATIILLVLAMALLVVPAAVIASTPGGTNGAGFVTEGPGSRDNSGSPSSKVTAIDESFNGSAVRVARGDILLVQLPERETGRAWQFDGGSAFKVVSDTVLETYPSRHDFRVKVLGPGDLRFNKVDNRDGYTVDTFIVTVTLKKGKPDNDSSGALPMW